MSKLNEKVKRSKITSDSPKVKGIMKKNKSKDDVSTKSIVKKGETENGTSVKAKGLAKKDMKKNDNQKKVESDVSTKSIVKKGETENGTSAKAKGLAKKDMNKNDNQKKVETENGTSAKAKGLAKKNMNKNDNQKKVESGGKRDKSKKRKNDNPKKHLKNAAKKAKFDPNLAPKPKKNQAPFTAKIDFLHNLKRDVTFDKMKPIQLSLRQGLFKARREETGIFVVDDIDVQVKNMTDKYKSKTIDIENEELDDRMICLKRVHNILGLLDVFSKGSDNFYRETADEIHAMIQAKEFDVEVVLDMTFALVSRKELLLTCIAKLLIKEFSAIINEKQFDYLIETITKPGTSILSGEDEEDDEFAPITDEDLAELEAKKAKEIEDDDEEEDDDETEDDDDGDESDSDSEPEEVEGNEDTNESMILALKKALGKAAITGDDDSDIELDDATLEKIDERLSEALQTFTPHGKRMKQQMAQKLRKDISALGGIVFAEVPLKTLLVLLHRFMEIIAEAEEKNRTDLYRALDEVCRGMRYRKTDESIDASIMKEFLNIINSVLELSLKVHNSNLEAGLINISRYLIDTALKNKKSKDTVIKRLEKFFDQYFEEKEKSSGFGIINELIVRHHDLFLSFLPKSFDIFVKKPSKKNQAAVLLSLFNRRDWKKAHPEVYGKTADMIIDSFQLEIEDDSKKIEKTFKELGNRTHGFVKK